LNLELPVGYFPSHDTLFVSTVGLQAIQTSTILTLGISVKWLSQHNLTIQFNPQYSLVTCMTVSWVSRITLNSLFHSHVNVMHPVQPSSIPLPSHRVIKHHPFHEFLPPIYVTLTNNASFALEHNFWSGAQKTHF
jgi:hypothetical protein